MKNTNNFNEYPINIIKEIYLLDDETCFTCSGYINLDNPVQLELCTMFIENLIVKRFESSKDQRIADIIISRAKGETYTSIGKRYGITGSRISGIRDKGFRCLRHPNTERKFRIIKEALFGTKGEVNFADVLTEYERVQTILYRVEEERKLMPERMPELEDTIDTLKFSVRTYNALRKAKIDTLSDLYNITIKEDWVREFLKIRGLGYTSFQEIAAKLIELGYIREDEIK